MAGASLTIGLLSFGGILAIWPILPLAFAGFVLSVAYEGEIYLQNIKGSLKKLFKSNHLERQLAKKCLLDHFPNVIDEDCPQFFKDYESQLQLFHEFEDKRLNKASRNRKRHVEKTLVDMEKWFAVQLFSDPSQQGLTGYQKELRVWFDESSLRDAFQAKQGSRRGIYNLLKAFCVTAGLFMGLGTTYLLVEAFAIIPWLAVIPAATLPLLIVPMAAIAGVAYGLLVYNAMTDMIATDMVSTWYQKLYNNIDKKPFGRRVVMGTGLVVMFTLTLVLSICTAGTWWTVAKSSQPLFRWMGKMPGFIMLVLNPLIAGISTLAFNLENISETLELLEARCKPVDPIAVGLPVNPIAVPLPDVSEKIRNWLQWLRQWNLPRLFIGSTFLPLIRLLFVGHVFSISATADQVPGVWPIVPMILGGGSEFVEDFHYFNLFGKQAHVGKHDTESLLKARLGADAGHSHDSDMPTKFLTVLFSPFYLLAVGWDMLCNGEREAFSSWEGFRKEFRKTLDGEMGVTAEENIDFSSSILTKPTTQFNQSQQPVQQSVSPQLAWQFEQAVYRIECHIEKHLQDLVGETSVGEQRKHLTALQAALGKYAAPSEPRAATLPSIAEVVEQHHSFFKSVDKAGTYAFLDALPARVAQGA